MEALGIEPGTPGTVSEYAHHYTTEAGLLTAVFSFFLNGSVYYIRYILLLYMLRVTDPGIKNPIILGIDRCFSKELVVLIIKTTTRLRSR